MGGGFDPRRLHSLRVNSLYCNDLRPPRAQAINPPPDRGFTETALHYVDPCRIR